MTDMESQMNMFDEGGLKDEGGTVDPVSGNEVPAGSTKKEVRDDIPAQLSEGEFVFPADVVRYIGLENLMELRQKAKFGLQKMEDMGQMGNSDEAIMDDDGEYDDEIDKLIDEWNPTEGELQMAPGGVVPDDLPLGFQAPKYRAPTIDVPTYKEFMGGSDIPTYTTKQYIGPNGELMTVTFIDGEPVQDIPDGYTEYKAGDEGPKVEEVKVKPVGDQEDSSDDREREAEREAQMKRDKEINNTLASYNEKFAKQWSSDPFNTGKLGAGGPMGAIFEGVQTHLARTEAIESIAKDLGIDLEDYENTGLAGVFSKYDDERFARDLQAKMEDEEEEDFPVSITPDKVTGRMSYDVDEDDPVSTPRGKDITSEVREALAQQIDERSPDDVDSEDSGTTGTGSASAVGGEDTDPVGPFSKGGAVEQTAAMLTPQKKTRGRRSARKK